MTPPTMTIICDTREQRGYDFAGYPGTLVLSGTLKTGDYAPPARGCNSGAGRAYNQYGTKVSRLTRQVKFLDLRAVAAIVPRAGEMRVRFGGPREPAA